VTRVKAGSRPRAKEAFFPEFDAGQLGRIDPMEDYFRLVTFNQVRDRFLILGGQLFMQ